MTQAEYVPAAGALSVTISSEVALPLEPTLVPVPPGPLKTSRSRSVLEPPWVSELNNWKRAICAPAATGKS